MTIGHSIPFRLLAATPTVVFTKDSGDEFGETRQEREPEALVVVNTSGSQITVTVEIVYSSKHFGGATYYVAKDHPIPAAEVGRCLLSDVVLRDDDSLRVTVSGTADVHVRLEAPEEKRTLQP